MLLHSGPGMLDTGRRKALCRTKYDDQSTSLTDKRHYYYGTW
jgi:hypothetical protein